MHCQFAQHWPGHGDGVVLTTTFSSSSLLGGDLRRSLAIVPWLRSPRRRGRLASLDRISWTKVNARDDAFRPIISNCAQADIEAHGCLGYEDRTAGTCGSRCWDGT